MDYSKSRSEETRWLGIFLLAGFVVFLGLGIHKSLEFASGTIDVVVVQQSDGSLKPMAAHYQNGHSLQKGPVFLSPNNFAEALMDALSSLSPRRTVS